VQPGSVASTFPELKPGAKLLDVMAGGEWYRRPSLEKATELITTAIGELRLVVAPLLDRYGFIVGIKEFTDRPVTRKLVRSENEELRKWQKRVGTVGAWKRYSERKPEKLRQRIREGVPDAVRGFVWKAIAAARAPRDFRQDGLYHSLRLHQGHSPSVLAQIEKDVPRTMTGHIFFRADNARGQEALRQILRAYAAFNPELGYTQGMSSYAAVLLLYMSEEDAFWVFATAMEHCTLTRLFEDGFPLLHHYYDTWETLLRKHVPRLATHIHKELASFMGLEVPSYERMQRSDDRMRFMIPGFYTTSWFQSMLVGGEHPAPSAMAPRIMDNLLLDGNLSIIFGLAIALMKQEKTLLLRQRGDSLADALKSLPTQMFEVESLASAALELNIKDKYIYCSEDSVSPSRRKEQI